MKHFKPNFELTATHYRNRMLIAAHKEYVAICEEIGHTPVSLKHWLCEYDIMSRTVDFAYYYQVDDIPSLEIDRFLRKENK